MNVILTRYTPDPIMAIEEAAANCYGGDPNKDGRVMNACYDSGHLSVFEFAEFTFHIEGVSRALLAQLTRHRHAGFAVKSQRYTTDNLTYIAPPTASISPAAYEAYRNCMETIHRTYRSLLDEGVPPEDARLVLPNACCTDLEIITNLRELMHICNERLCNRAQWEIRWLVQLMRNEVLRVMPEAKRFLVPKCEMYSPYNYCTERKGCSRHKKLSEIYNIGGEDIFEDTKN